MNPSRRLLAVICVAAALGATVAAPPPTLAAGNAVINDCQSHGTLTRAYTVGQLRHALAVMPASVKQYTSCFDVVQNALVSARKHNGKLPVSTGKGGSSFLPTPVIIILVVLILGAVTFGALAIRRRRAGQGAGAGEDRPDGPEGPGEGAETRVMPSVPRPPSPHDTAETRPLPSVPPPEGTPDEGTAPPDEHEDERS